MILEILYLCAVLVVSASINCENEACLSARIVEGVISEQNGRPFQVALYLRVGTTGELGFCGASLIHPEWLLSAAHCCFHDGEEVNHVQAILGAHSLYDRYENGRRVVNVGEIVIHPDWDPETLDNDIALLKLANVVQLTDMVNVVRLPYRNISAFNFAGTAAIASGWGISAEGVPFVSPTLRQKQMVVITNILCNRTYFNELPETIVCALQENAGTCKGDNGGPLTINYRTDPEEDGEAILIGVTSFISSTGCNSDMPSVFTRVASYLDWISQVTGMELL